MMRIRLLTAVVCLVGLVAIVAAAKPPPAPTLGVPHVISDVLTAPSAGQFGAFQVFRSVSCPSSEVALSGVVAGENANAVLANNDVRWQARPILNNNQPTGYEFSVSNIQDSQTTALRFSVTCAPVNS
jgi:hypothetical protein